MGKRIKICSQLVVLIAVLYVISGAVIGVTKKIEYHNESIIEIAPTQVFTSKDESTYYFDMISATNNWRLDYSVAFVSVVLGIVLFLLWFASNKNIKKDTSMLYFSMFSVILGIWLFNETELSYTVLYDRGIASLISYVLLLILGIPYVMYVNEYLEVTKLKLSYIIVSLNCVTAIALIIGHATGIYEFRQSAWIINLLLSICLMYTVYGII